MGFTIKERGVVMQKISSYVENFERTQYEETTRMFSEGGQVKARYVKAFDKTVQGHRLIEALPPMRDWKHCNLDFEQCPDWTEDIRKESAFIRYQLADHLSDFRITREFITEIDSELYSAIIRCYKQRIPNEMPGGRFGECGFYKTTNQSVPGVLILGDSGAGKTTAVLHALSYLPQLIVHEMENARMYQIPYINVVCPPDGSVKNFFDLCIEEFERITGNSFQHYKRATADEKAELFRNLALRFHLGIVIVDEIQNLLKAKNRLILNHFLVLANELSLPFVFVGTNNIVPFLKGAEFFTLRRIGKEIHVGRFKKDSIWENFLRKLWKYQWTQEEIPFTQEMSDIFYYESSGIIDRAIELYRNAQKKAIKIGIDTKESFTPEFVKSIANRDFSLSSEGLQILAAEGSGIGKGIPCDLQYDSESVFEKKKNLELPASGSGQAGKKEKISTLKRQKKRLLSKEDLHVFQKASV